MRAYAAGLEEAVSIRCLDYHYRELSGCARNDVMVSVGTAEHIGTARLPEYFGAAYDRAKAGGRGASP